MNPEFLELINEAVLVEMNVAELYLLFHEQYGVDRALWWQLAMEEQNHAALLKTVRQMQTQNMNIPPEMFPANKADLQRTNREVRDAIESFRINPDRERALRTAYRIETSAGELHFDRFMKAVPGSMIHNVFRKLNGADLDHSRRIRDYMDRMQIPLDI